MKKYKVRYQSITTLEEDVMAHTPEEAIAVVKSGNGSDNIKELDTSFNYFEVVKVNAN